MKTKTMIEKILKEYAEYLLEKYYDRFVTGCPW